MTPRTIRKTLSANDAGETGGHQAGILIPRDRRILTFFPQLNTSELNPRTHITFEDAAGTPWEFAFIYYNNRRFGGTRNEYRLTRMTRYIRQATLPVATRLFFTATNTVTTPSDTRSRTPRYQPARGQYLRLAAAGTSSTFRNKEPTKCQRRQSRSSPIQPEPWRGCETWATASRRPSPISSTTP